ncbi:hypothetical protein EV363DRAFT_1238003 [Boletus edulis]|nr:hypothetical protein EV363DRAFT_1238003 [Boletus edulis]
MAMAEANSQRKGVMIVSTKKLRTYFCPIHVRGIDVHIDKTLLWSPGHFWNIQTPPNLKKTSAISRASRRDFIALRTGRNTHRPACGTANTSLIWGGCPRESSNVGNGKLVAHHLRDKWMEALP